MEWKIFIKALVSTGLVVSISLLKVFACAALSLASGGGASCKGETGFNLVLAKSALCHLGRIDLNFKLEASPPMATKITICQSWLSS